jgi:hypothetical protein
MQVLYKCATNVSQEMYLCNIDVYISYNIYTFCWMKWQGKKLLNFWQWEFWVQILMLTSTIIIMLMKIVLPLLKIKALKYK